MSSVGATDLPHNYKVVSISADLTGSKLIDEIYYIAAYVSSDESFDQYIMPYGDVSRGTTRAQGVKVQTVFGRYRVLKDVRSLNVLTTKTAYSALVDLLAWLQKVAEGVDGLILAYHDNNKENVIPGILSLLEQYKLHNQFFGIVKGFVSVYKVATNLTNESASWAYLIREVLKYDDVRIKQRPVNTAQKRAKLTHVVLATLLNLEIDQAIPAQHILGDISDKEKELENLEKRRLMIAKVKSLRPIFLQEMKKGAKERSRAIVLRQYLIDAEVNYDQLSEAYTGVGFQNLFPSTENKKIKKNIDELVELLSGYFKGRHAKFDSPGKENEDIDKGLMLNEGGAVVKRKNSNNVRRKLRYAKKSTIKSSEPKASLLKPLEAQN